MNAKASVSMSGRFMALSDPREGVVLAFAL